jgi:hypothetical protein
VVEIKSLILVSKDSIQLYSHYDQLVSSLKAFEMQETEILLITTVREINYSKFEKNRNLNIRIFVVNQLDFIETGFNFGIENSIGDDLFLINLDDFQKEDFLNVMQIGNSGGQIIAVQPKVLRNLAMSFLKKVFDSLYRFLVGHSIDQESITILRINRSEVNNSWTFSNPVLKIRRLVIENSSKVTVIKNNKKIKKSRFYKDDIAKGLLLLATSSTKLLRIVSSSSLLFSAISLIQCTVIAVKYFSDFNASLTTVSIVFTLSMLFSLISFAIAILFELIIAEINNRNVSGSTNIREIGKFGIFKTDKKLNIEELKFD